MRSITSVDQHSETRLPDGTTAASPLWSRFACARCRYRWERPGTPEPGDLSRDCPLCHGQLQAVTVYKIGEPGAASASALLPAPL
jgi:hypothetical protein